MRAFLSILWLVIWVFSVTVMISVGEWLKSQVLWEFENATTNTITVIAWKSFNPFEPQRQTEIPWFTESDIAFFADSIYPDLYYSWCLVKSIHNQYIALLKKRELFSVFC